MAWEGNNSRQWLTGKGEFLGWEISLSARMPPGPSFSFLSLDKLLYGLHASGYSSQLSVKQIKKKKLMDIDYSVPMFSEMLM